jgi:hypothetical protein
MQVDSYTINSKVSRGEFTPSGCLNALMEAPIRLMDCIAGSAPGNRYVNNLTSDPGTELLEVSGFPDSACQLRERRSMKPQALRRARINGAIRAECG